jgi:hypothetical protein
VSGISTKPLTAGRKSISLSRVLYNTTKLETFQLKNLKISWFR